jgi:hypothetical protein
MSFEELKAVVDSATEEERIFLAAYLRVKRDGGNGPLGSNWPKLMSGCFAAKVSVWKTWKRCLAKREDRGIGKRKAMKWIGLDLIIVLALIFLTPVQGVDNDGYFRDRSAHFAVEHKLNAIFVSVDFSNATIEQVTETLAEKCKQSAYDHKALRFEIGPEASSTALRITLKLNHVPLGVALHYACELGQLRYKVVEDYVVVTPEFTVDGEGVCSRTFHVDPSFFESTSHAGLTPSP